jgi:hypothetical protein
MIHLTAATQAGADLAKTWIGDRKLLDRAGILARLVIFGRGVCVCAD